MGSRMLRLTPRTAMDLIRLQNSPTWSRQRGGRSTVSFEPDSSSTLDDMFIPQMSRFHARAMAP